jgi:hypothetical protein
VFGRNLPCEPVRKWTPERNAIGHTLAHFKRSNGVKLNGILEFKFLPENAHRTGCSQGALDGSRRPTCR